MASEIDENLEEVYAWIEQMTFSKPKKNLARDFSDGGIEETIFYRENVSSTRDKILINFSFYGRVVETILP